MYHFKAFHASLKNQRTVFYTFYNPLFQVISNCQRKEHRDVHRFEKISNIIKQFKLSCSKLAASFQSMEVRNSNFAAFIDIFTSNTYVMVIMSDPNICESFWRNKYNIFFVNFSLANQLLLHLWIGNKYNNYIIHIPSPHHKKKVFNTGLFIWFLMSVCGERKIIHDNDNSVKVCSEEVALSGKI